MDEHRLAIRERQWKKVHVGNFPGVPLSGSITDKKVRATQMRTLADILFRMARLRHFVCPLVLQLQVQSRKEKTKDLAFRSMKSPRKNLTDAANFSHGVDVVLPTRVIRIP